MCKSTAVTQRDELKVSPLEATCLLFHVWIDSCYCYWDTTHLHVCTSAALVALLSLLQGLRRVFIESTVVKDDVSGAGFVMGVVETLLSFWLH